MLATSPPATAKELATGTAPMVVASTTKVANLNADKLDDQDGAYYLAYANFTGTPTIPANISDLNDDSSFITATSSNTFTNTTIDLGTF